MPLQAKDQLNLLSDILRSHHLDQCGSTSECQQLERLTHSLLQNPSTPAELKETLSLIHAYGQRGGQMLTVNEHINGHQSNLTQWMGTLSSSNTENII